MTLIPKADLLVHRTDSINRIHGVDGTFRVSFSEHASCYHTTVPALQQSIRAAHATKREVSFSASPDCEILSVTMHPPRGLARRVADGSERLTDILTRRSTRWWRDAQRRATK